MIEMTLENVMLFWLYTLATIVGLVCMLVAASFVIAVILDGFNAIARGIERRRKRRRALRERRKSKGGW
jgi:membrane protein implicated in regulation of membrane protease activity